MNPVEWYYARENKQLGPVSPLELKRLAEVGLLGPDDLVWHEGMTEWASARNVRGLFDEEGRAVPSPAAEQPAAAAVDVASKASVAAAKPRDASRDASRHFLDGVLDGLRPHFNADFIETTSGVFHACGSYGLYVASAVTAIFALIAAAKIAPLEGILFGVIGILTLLALQYVAGKALNALNEINVAVAGRLSSALLPNCLAVLSKVAAVGFLLASVAKAAETSQYAWILVGVAEFLVFAFLAVVAMNPASLNIAVAPEGTAGEEAIGAIMFVVKSLLRVAPVAFGVGVICGTLVLCAACYEAFGDEPSASVAIASEAANVLLRSAALPLGAYLLFLMTNLVLNIWRSVLSLPAKLDRLSEKSEEEEKKA
jgi:hypothetical protein